MNPLSTGDPLRLGPYRLLGVLGEGGMGKVYIGQDSAGGVAAIKVLRPELAHEEHLVQRFFREAHAAQAVVSKGVARVLAARTDDARPWMATEFLAGPTLDEAVDQHGALGEPAVRALAASLARTLADVHAAGLIHRDLKPSNIVLTSSGPRVIDFGIARPQHGLTLTTTGQIPVTPGYGAPEQVLGHRVSAAADLFSLGAVLVYAASGQRAFDASHVAALQYEVVHGEPRLDGVPEALRPLIEPCLAKDPAFRPPPDRIVRAFAPPRGADRAWRRGPVADEIGARERSVHQLTADTVTPGAEPAGRFSRRRLLTVLGAGGAVLAAGGGTAAVLLSSADDTSFDIPPARKTPKARVLSADAGDYIVGEDPKAIWGPFDVLGTNAPSPVPVRDVLAIGNGSDALEARNVVDGKRRWTAGNTDTRRGILSLSDRLLASADADGTLRTFVASTGEPKWTAGVAAWVLLAADDKTVYLVTEDGELRAVNSADAQVRWTAKIPARHRQKIEGPGAVGGGRLFVSTKDGGVLTFRTADGRLAWSLEDLWDKPVTPTVHGDTVYVNGRVLSAHSVRDGEQRWKQASRDLLDNDPEAWGPPTVHGSSLYATHGTTFRRMKRADGSKVWDARGSSSTGVRLAVQGNGVWGIDTELENELSVGDIAEGKTVWDPQLHGGGEVGLVAAGNRVFVRTGGNIRAMPVF
ncbi:protein kinase domain-containing protein [Streptomyces iconiensis]|uniref:Serine/threonine-protein kinase n=1 Tax=Streptomyces iconiensis TaxID=1384038 RepID=A0ABT7A6L4_9ACTN|nr:serine/threonine-protein kinase [Streptomyces iconiensis]MDJ1136949.1 serine/threonine-protein kinase [Streptomyces iconiensis]